jgi:Leu/Phe-tRNA-protein transferase
VTGDSPTDRRVCSSKPSIARRSAALPDPETQRQIFPISRELLEDEDAMEIIASNLDYSYYWSDDWDPEFYVALARAGFISTSTEHPDVGSVLIPELQRAYAVLDEQDLHISRKVAKIIRSGRLEEEDIRLEVSDDCGQVIDRLLAYHSESNWLSPAYRELLGQLPTAADSPFRLRGIKLWSRSENRIIAGELGYTIGRTYTSLSGFCDPCEKRWRNFGTLQLVLLAQRLHASGYAFWNLGHPQLTYKGDLGAKPSPRPTFLARWKQAILERPRSEL